MANYRTSFTAVCDIFENNTTLYERLSDALQALGVDLNAPIVDDNGINHSTSSFTAILRLSEEQKIYLENIVNTEDKSNREKYILCVNFLNP